MPSQSLNTHTHTHAHTHAHTLHGLEANKDNKQNKIQPRIMAKQITMKTGQLNEERDQINDQINERELSSHCFFFASFEIVPSERGGGGGGKLGTKKPSRGSNTTINCIASSL